MTAQAVIPGLSPAPTNHHELVEWVERIAAIERGRSQSFFVEIGPLINFYPAEEYHQNYLEKNPGGYCHIPREEIELFSRLRIDPGDYQKPAAEAIRLTHHTGNDCWPDIFLTKTNH